MEQGPVHDAQDVCDRDLLRRRRKPVAASPAAVRIDVAGPSHVPEDVLEERLRNRLRLGQRVGGRAERACRGEFDACSQRVVGPSGDPHTTTWPRTRAVEARTWTT